LRRQLDHIYCSHKKILFQILKNNKGILLYLLKIWNEIFQPQLELFSHHQNNHGLSEPLPDIYQIFPDFIGSHSFSCPFNTYYFCPSHIHHRDHSGIDNAETQSRQTLSFDHLMFTQE
jgi:hypothetical protein